MKRILLCFLMLVSVIFTGCTSANVARTSDDGEYLRIHIRANSNSEIDQSVKYKVKESVVSYIADLIVGSTTKQQLVCILEQNMTDIENVCDQVLRDKGFTYLASGQINNEYFPTRAYGDYVLESDFYDALIINLGSGQGDNWWCVVYPPLCFVNAKEVDDKGFRYKSKIMEMINSFWGK